MRQKFMQVGNLCAESSTLISAYASDLGSIFLSSYIKDFKNNIYVSLTYHLAVGAKQKLKYENRFTQS